MKILARRIVGITMVMAMLYSSVVCADVENVAGDFEETIELNTEASDTSDGSNEITEELSEDYTVDEDDQENTDDSNEPTDDLSDDHAEEGNDQEDADDSSVYQAEEISNDEMIYSDGDSDKTYQFRYSIIDDNSVRIYGIAGTASGDLEIPSVIDGKSVTTIGTSAFDDWRGFTGSLTIPNSVTTIEANAFSGCSGFTGSLTIPNSVTSIGEHAFNCCSGFTGNLTIPNSITTIKKGTFHKCSGFKGKLTIPNSVTTIEEGAFADCSGFTGSLTIPDSVTTIGPIAFRNCSGFKGSLTISKNVTKLKSTFIGCSGFTGSLTIPDGVTELGATFSGCSGFTGSLTIPDSVTIIAGNTFRDCSGFTGRLTIPNSVKEISDRDFDGCSGLTGDLTIPNSVTRIGYIPFKSCDGLTSLTIPSSVTLMSNEIFVGCRELKIVINNSSCDLQLPKGYKWLDEKGNVITHIKNGTAYREDAGLDFIYLNKLHSYKPGKGYWRGFEFELTQETTLNLCVDAKKDLSVSEYEITIKDDNDKVMPLKDDDGNSVDNPRKVKVSEGNNILLRRIVLDGRRTTAGEGVKYRIFVKQANKDNYGFSDSCGVYITTYREGFDLTKDTTPVANIGELFCLPNENGENFRIPESHYLNVYGEFQTKAYDLHQEKWIGYCKGMSICGFLNYEKKLYIPATEIGFYHNYPCLSRSRVSRVQELFGDYTVWQYSSEYDDYKNKNENKYLFGGKINYAEFMKAINEKKNLIIGLEKNFNLWGMIAGNKSVGHAVAVDTCRNALEYEDDKGTKWARVFIYDCNMPFYYNYSVKNVKTGSCFKEAENRYIEINESGDWRIKNVAQTQNNEPIDLDSGFSLTSTAVISVCDTEGIPHSFSGDMHYYPNAPDNTKGKEKVFAEYIEDGTREAEFIALAKNDKKLVDVARGFLSDEVLVRVINGNNQSGAAAVKTIFTLPQNATKFELSSGEIKLLRDDNMIKISTEGTANVELKSGTEVVITSPKEAKVDVVVSEVSPEKEKFSKIRTSLKVDSKKTVVKVNKGKASIDASQKQTIPVELETESGKKITKKVSVDKIKDLDIRNEVEKDKKVLVKSIKINPSSKTLKKGKTVTLKAKITPENATNKAVAWKSSNKKVAKVNSKGKVTAVAPGTAKITATAKDGSKKKATATIKVKGVALNGKKLTVQKGKTSKTIKATVISDAIKSVKSSNKKVATVKLKGKKLNIKGVSNGKANITVKAKSGMKATLKVTVQKDKVTTKTLKLSKSTVNLAGKGKTATVKVTATPDRLSTNEKIKVTNSKKSVASFKINQNTGEITVTAKKKGTCKLTVKVGKKTKKITVKVTK